MRDADKQYLVNHYYDYFRMALTILKDQEDAKDAVQEALAQTMSRTFVRDVHAYCIKVLRNCCTNRLRERYRLQETAVDIVDEEPDMQYEQRILLMNRVKRQLPKESRRLLDMHYEKGLTVDEIASVLGKKHNWVKKKLQVILGEMREEMIKEESKQKDI